MRLQQLRQLLIATDVVVDECVLPSGFAAGVADRRVGAVLQEQFGDLTTLGVHDDGVFVVLFAILGVHVGAGVDQKLDERQFAAVDSPHQRSAPVFVPGVND